MQLGNKLQHTMLNMGSKKNSGIQFLGNKINSQSNRHVLPIPPHNVVNRTSPIEKYHTNNH